MIRNTLLALGMTALLAGCFETPEEMAARENQFIGKTVPEVAAVIGPPTVRDRNIARWISNTSTVNRIPISHYMNGVWVTTGYRNERIELHCKFTATLSKGRVVAADYQGNDCNRFAPRLKK